MRDISYNGIEDRKTNIGPKRKEDSGSFILDN